MSYLNGMAPGWSTVPFKTVVDRAQYGLSLSASEEGNTPILKMNSINGSGLSLESLDTVVCDDATRERFRVRKGDLLFNRTNSKDLVGKAAVALEDTQAVFASYIVRFQLNKRMNPRFAGYWFQTEWVKARLQAIATPGVSQWNINPTTLQKALCVPDVPIKEQEKIVDVLSACDTAIAAQARLLAFKQDRKKGLAQRLLTGKVRFPEFAGQPWREVRLGEAFSERTEAGRPDLELLAVTGSGGIVKRAELNRRDTSSEDKSKYKRVCPDDIAYNTMRMWQGVSGLSPFEGIVSPAYTVLVAREGILPAFAAHFFKLPATIHLFHRYSQGLVNDTLNLKYPQFRVIHVRIPPVGEQRKIAETLSALDAEIALQHQKLEQLKQQKKGLMQLLLTGKVRVKA